MSTPKEDTIEKFLDSEARRRGGFTVKLHPRGNKGIPDRLVVLPGRMVLVETKRPRGGVVARLQYWWQKRFTDLGHEAVVVRTQEEVTKLLDSQVPVA